MVGPENQKRYEMRDETGRLWPQAGMAPEMDRDDDYLGRGTSAANAVSRSIQDYPGSPHGSAPPLACLLVS